MSAPLPILPTTFTALLTPSVISPLVEPIACLTLTTPTDEPSNALDAPLPPESLSASPPPPEPARSSDSLLGSHLETLDREQEQDRLSRQGGEEGLISRGGGGGEAGGNDSVQLGWVERGKEGGARPTSSSASGKTNLPRTLVIKSENSELPTRLSPSENRALLDHASSLWPDDISSTNHLKIASFLPLGSDDGLVNIPFASLASSDPS